MKRILFWVLTIAVLLSSYNSAAAAGQGSDSDKSKTQNKSQKKNSQEQKKTPNLPKASSGKKSPQKKQSAKGAAAEPGKADDTDKAAEQKLQGVSPQQVTEQAKHQERMEQLKALKEEAVKGGYKDVAQRVDEMLQKEQKRYDEKTAKHDNRQVTGPQDSKQSDAVAAGQGKTGK